MAVSGENFSLDPIVREAIDTFNICLDWERQTRKYQLDDLKFVEGDAYNGYQWPGGIRQDRELESKPCLTINKTRQHCLQIINDIKQNRPGIKVRATGGGASYQSAQIINALIKHIEYRSNAPVAYDKAADFQVKTGYGALRVVTEYVDNETDDQEILIEMVRDPLTVYIDPDAREADKKDARFGFVCDLCPKDLFEKKYPQYKDIGGERSVLGQNPGWLDEHHIMVAEYYKKESKKDTLYTIVGENGQVSRIKKSILKRDARYTEEQFEQLDNDDRVRKREIDEISIKWFLIVGEKIVDEKDIPGKYIPLVPVIGEETIIDGTMDRKGHVRALLDPQRMYNWWSPLALDTPLPTPDGWTTMAYVKPGDMLLDEKGKPVEVAGVSPIFINRKCYEVKFNDGTSIIADEGHLWTVEERGKRTSQTWDWNRKTIPTKELTPDKHFIWATMALDLPEIRLPIDPYFLGAWLGDGTAVRAEIISGNIDAEEMRGNLIERGLNVNEPYKNADGCSVRLTIPGMFEILKNNNLINNKHIPPEYLRASYEQRMELLRGMMDTDGSFIVSNHKCSYTTVSPAIAQGFHELVRSLGFKVNYCIREGKRRKFPNGKEYNCQQSYQFSFTASPTKRVFALSRKYKEQCKSRETHMRRTRRHKIVSVNEVSSVPVKCVGINSKSHLFLAGDGMIPTHNSYSVEAGASQGKTPYIAPVESVEGYENYWSTANRIDHAWLPYKSRAQDGTELPMPQKTQPAVAAPVALTGMQIASQEFGFVSGQYEAQMGQQGNERTGDALNERRISGDNATAHYRNNLGVAIGQVGRIILDWIPFIYDTQRVMQIISLDEQPLELIIDPSMKEAYQQRKNEEGIVVSHAINPKFGRYEVQADIGPGYATQREAAFEAYKLILTQSPQLTAFLGDILFRAADFPHAEEAAQRLRRLVPAYALGEGPSPEVSQLQNQVQQLTKLLAETMEDLSKREIQLKGKEQMRDIDVYRAFSDRLKILLDTKLKAADTMIKMAQAERKEGENKENRNSSNDSSNVSANVSITADDVAAALRDLMPDIMGMEIRPIAEENAQLRELRQPELPFQPQLNDMEGIKRDYAGRPFGRDFSNSKAFRPL